MREYQVRICERLGVKFPGPTRHGRKGSSESLSASASPLIADVSADVVKPSRWANRRHGAVVVAEPLFRKVFHIEGNDDLRLVSLTYALQIF